MKELSIEEKAKRYDESLERANKVLLDCTSEEQNVVEYIFPELAKSEDERIRKALIRYFTLSDEHAYNEACGVSYRDIVAWLEKQGEQKPADKVEPKFKVGDWVVNEFGHLKHITKIKNDCYYAEGEFVEWHGTFEYGDTHFRLWTIQDAKAGDVLSFNDGHGNDCIELIKSITGKKIEFWFCLTNGNSYEVFDGIIPYTNLVSREDATPATKEQRNLLFQKMHEAGYEWSDKDKKLIKIVK